MGDMLQNAARAREQSQPISGASLQPRLRLDTLARLRWLAIAGQSAALIFVALVLRYPTPLAAAAVVVLAATVLNVFLQLRFPASHRFGSRTSAMLLGFDVLQLAALLYMTGGLQNPFALLFLAPVMISASTLEPRFTIALGGLAIVLASILALVHWPLPWVEGQRLELPPTYVAGIWIAVLLGLGFIGVYAWRVADEARQMERALAATERVLAHEYRLSALDGLAAAAAHQLGTPLATIAVVVREMQRSVEPASPLYEDIELLWQETGRCRDILGKIASLPMDSGGPLGRHNLIELIDEIVEPHRNFGIEINVATIGPPPPPEAPRNPGVLYGLGNIVENAVDFAAARVGVTAHWSSTEVRLTITDDGPGFPAETLTRIGEPYVSARAQPGGERRGGGGLGLGLFIAKTLLERSGATLSWGNVPGGGGARIEIIWPRASFGTRPDILPE